MNRAHLRAAAEAYAHVNSVESACYHYLNDGFCPNAQAHISLHYINSTPTVTKVLAKYIQKVIDTALAELQYPLPSDESDVYAWTGNQRAAFANIPTSTWHRNQLCEHVNFFIKDIRSNSYTVWREICKQLET